MPTDYSDQFYSMDPYAPPAGGTSLTPVRYDFTDENDDGFIEIDDTFEGLAITGVYSGDVIQVNVPGTGVVTITGVTFYVAGGGRYFTPIDGKVLQDATFVQTNSTVGYTPVPVSELGPPCFTPGTLIDTIEGPRPVEKISEGDMILTRDAGFQPIAWIGRCVVRASGHYAPIRISNGALGNTRDLIVSPQHRVVVEGWAAELYAGQDAVLVPAKHLVDGHKVHVVEGGDVEYIHLGFADHALVRSEGIWTESHFASTAAKDEADALFSSTHQPATLVRPAAKRHESKMIAASVLS